MNDCSAVFVFICHHEIPCHLDIRSTDITREQFKRSLKIWSSVTEHRITSLVVRDASVCVNVNASVRLVFVHHNSGIVLQLVHACVCGRYANRAKNIKNKPKINEDPKDALLREFQEEIARLKAALEAKGGGGGGGGGQKKRGRKQPRTGPDGLLLLLTLFQFTGLEHMYKGYQWVSRWEVLLSQ